MPAQTQENLARMIRLANEVFGMKQDPTQISVNGKVMARLRKIHASAMIEKRTKNGPIAWILIFPTTNNLMKQFIKRQINERDLLKKTPLGVKYDAMYLCSALVLPEYRRKGLAKRLMCKAIKSIQKQNPIKSLFYWGFSAEGKKLAVSVAKSLSLPLCKKVD
jgi:ribosomal protein S18 acetylase RimI-like enzyme